MLYTNQPPWLPLHYSLPKTHTTSWTGHTSWGVKLSNVNIPGDTVSFVPCCVVRMCSVYVVRLVKMLIHLLMFCLFAYVVWSCSRLSCQGHRTNQLIDLQGCTTHCGDFKSVRFGFSASLVPYIYTWIFLSFFLGWYMGFFISPAQSIFLLLTFVSSFVLFVLTKSKPNQKMTKKSEHILMVRLFLFFPLTRLLHIWW